MDRSLRARVLVSEAQAMGLSVEDLVAAAAGTVASSSAVPTVSDYLATIMPTLHQGHAAHLPDLFAAGRDADR
jgi:hypothetical protein